MNRWVKNSIVLLTTVSFLGILFLGPIFPNHLSHITHEGCPFASNEQGMCPMMSLEHVDYVATSVLKIFYTAVAVIIPMVFGVLVVPEIACFRQRRIKNISLYQELFSQGILNPKAP